MPGYDVLLLRPVEHVVVEHHEAQRRIDRGGPAGRIKNMIEIARRHRRQALSQPGGRFCRVAPGAGIGQL